jgi:hypothetical protein
MAKSINQTESIMISFTVSDKEYTLPNGCEKFMKEMLYSEYMLKLEDDYDQEGSPAVNKELYFKVLDFVERYLNVIYNDRKVELFAGDKEWHFEINPCDDSIDISTGIEIGEYSAQLLMNFRKDGTISFFGGCKNDGERKWFNEIQNVIPIDGINDELVNWMMTYLS